MKNKNEKYSSVIMLLNKIIVEPVYYVFLRLKIEKNIKVCNLLILFGMLLMNAEVYAHNYEATSGRNSGVTTRCSSEELSCRGDWVYSGLYGKKFLENEFARKHNGYASFSDNISYICYPALGNIDFGGWQIWNNKMENDARATHECRILPKSYRNEFHTGSLTISDPICSFGHEPTGTDFFCNHVNQRPDITGPSLLEVQEGTTLSEAITAEDADNYPFPRNLVFTLEDGPNRWVTLDQYTGRLTITPPRGTAKKLAYILRVSVNDGLDSSRTSSIRLTVTPEPNIPPPLPNIVATPAKAFVGTKVSFITTINDPNPTDVLNFSWTLISLTNSNFSPIVKTGLDAFLIFTPTEKGVYRIALTAKDKLSSSPLASIEYTVVNSIPSIASLSPKKALVGKPVTVTASTIDRDLDALTFTWSITDSNNNLVVFTPNAAQVVAANTAIGLQSTSITFTPSIVGIYNINVVVNDGFGGKSNSALAFEGRTQHTIEPNDENNLAIDSERGPKMCFTSASNNGSNPINGSTGNKYQLETDYNGTGVQPIVFNRHYNSFLSVDTQSRSLGLHWRHSFERYMIVDRSVSPAVVTLIRPSGNNVKFTLDSTGNWKPNIGVRWRLSELNGEFDYIYDQDNVEHYNGTGQLITITTREGYQLKLLYNATNTLASVTDQHGRSLTFQYDSQGVLLQSITTPANLMINYGYIDANLTSVTYPSDVKPAGAVRNYLYTDTRFPSALTGIKDRNGIQYASFAYDALGRGILSTHAGGANSTSFKYGISLSGGGTGTQITDALSEVRNYSYVNNNGVQQVANIEGSSCASCGGDVSKINYVNGILSSTLDKKGITTGYSYNVRGLLEQTVGAQGTQNERVIDTTWHATFNLPVCQINPDHTIKTIYNSFGQVLTRTIYDTSDTLKFTNQASKHCDVIILRTDLAFVPQRRWGYSYYPVTNLLKTVDGPRTDVADVTTYSYYPNGDLQSVINALSQVTRYKNYDAHGRAQTIEQANGAVQSILYDVNGNLDKLTIYPDRGLTNGLLTDYFYDDVGLLRTVATPDGVTITRKYDDAQRLTDITDNAGNNIHYTLNGLGSIKKTDTFDPNGVLRRSDSAIFNTLNQLTQRNQGGVITNFSNFDANGNAQTRVQGGFATSYSYDEYNRIKTQVDTESNNSSATITYDYDAMGRTKSITDKRNNATIYRYDGLGNKTELISPDSGTTKFTDYDAAGNLLLQVVTRSTVQSITYSSSYDSLNRLKTVTTTAGSNTVYDYDVNPSTTLTCTNIGKLSRLTHTTVAGDIIISSWCYDGFGRLMNKQESISGTVVFNQSYQYNASTGLVVSINNPDGSLIEYQHSIIGKINKVLLDGKAIIQQVQYDPFGAATRWSWLDANGLSSTMTRTRNYLTTGQVDDSVTAFGATNLFSEKLLYETSNTGNIENIVDRVSNTTENYGYDPQKRLTSYTGSTVSMGYGYDVNGNRISFTQGVLNDSYVIPASSNWLTSITGNNPVTRQYDMTGNLINDGVRQLDYDDRGNLSQIVGTANYVSNGKSERVKKVLANGSQIYYFYNDASQLIAEADSSGTITQSYLYFQGEPLAMLSKPISGGTDPSVVLSITNTTTAASFGVAQWAKLAIGTLFYSDRIYEHQDYPIEWQDADVLQTANTDKFKTNVDNAISFDVNKPVVVNILYDSRQTVLPAWLSSYTDTGKIAKPTIMGLFNIYSKNFPAGTISLGGNWASPAVGADANYVVVVMPQVTANVNTKHLIVPMNLSYIHNDYLGTPQLVTNQAGTVIWSASYTPFGQATVNADPDGDGNIIELNIRFQGQYFDVESGLHYNYFRYYDPKTGRYITSDPIGLYGGLNTFGYVGGNPLISLDPFGLAKINFVDGSKVKILFENLQYSQYAVDFFKKIDNQTGFDINVYDTNDCSNDTFAPGNGLNRDITGKQSMNYINIYINANSTITSDRVGGGKMTSSGIDILFHELSHAYAINENKTKPASDRFAVDNTNGFRLDAYGENAPLRVRHDGECTCK